MEIRLYSTEHCHLCEQAEAILRGIGIKAIPVEITGDEGLMARYGVRIPVLQRMDTGAELGWPFDAARVLDFLNTPG